MKKIIYLILLPLGALAMFFGGFLARQPKINKLKKQIKLLQKDNGKLIDLCQCQHDDFCNLLVQHKTLKAIHFIKKASSKEKLRENLILQYALKSYIELLLKRVKYNQELDKDEIAFFNAAKNIIDGKKISAGNMVKIRDYILERHTTDINNKKECDYTLVLQELNSYKESA